MKAASELRATRRRPSNQMWQTDFTLLPRSLAGAGFYFIDDLDDLLAATSSAGSSARREDVRTH